MKKRDRIVNSPYSTVKQLINTKTSRKTKYFRAKMNEK
jgi:hypothetical protein